MVFHVLENTFEDLVLRSPLPVVVDFWAQWCGPCRQIAPILDEAATLFSGRAEIAKVDVDACPGLSVRYNIRSIPTLLLFQNGQVRSTVVGGMGKTPLLQWIEKSIAA